MLHILLVEDHPGDVLMVREALRLSVFPSDLMIAYDGEQALKLLGELQFKPDFVILDLNIPKFDGYTVLERYHTEGGPPVVVFTSSDRPEDKARVLRLGAKDYVVKPRRLQEFVEDVQDIVARWGRLTAASSPA